MPLGEASEAFERLVEENTRLKGKMQGIKMLGKADRDPPPVGPLPTACNASSLTKAGRCLCLSRCCPCDPVLAPGICVHFYSLVMAFPALTLPIPKGIFEGPRRKHAWGEEWKAHCVDLEPEWSPIGEVTCVKCGELGDQGSLRTQGLDARPGAELAQSSVLFFQLPLRSPLSIPTLPPSLPTPDHCTACFSLVPGLH